MKSKSVLRFSVMALLLSAAVATTSAMAQSTADQTVPGHPRVNEVNQRLSNQQNRIQNGVASGTMNAKQAARDEKHDSNIAQRESADEAKNGGHLTKTEQRNLNKSQNRNSKHIYKQKH